MNKVAQVPMSGRSPETLMDKPTTPKLSRRTVFAAAGGAGALAAVAAALPRAPAESLADTATELPRAPAEAVASTAAKPAAEKAGGYQETQHVLRYYQTTRV
jgi:molybdopterin-guanine dinucleotide biosynthesis protein A